MKTEWKKQTKDGWIDRYVKERYTPGKRGNAGAVQREILSSV